MLQLICLIQLKYALLEDLNFHFKDDAFKSYFNNFSSLINTVKTKLKKFLKIIYQKSIFLLNYTLKARTLTI